MHYGDKHLRSVDDPNEFKATQFLEIITEVQLQRFLYKGNAGMQLFVDTPICPKAALDACLFGLSKIETGKDNGRVENNSRSS